jgi:2-dehydropantoate 2-reductase
MKFAIVGAGGIGGYYGGVLARSGNEVQILARGENLNALREKGLQVRTPEGAFTVEVTACDDVAQFTPVDCAIIAVKTYSLADAAPAAKHLAEKGALIVPFLNGVDIAERLVELGVAKEPIVGGLTTISAARTAPGVFERKSNFQKIIIGEFPGGRDPARRQKVERIVQAFLRAGVEAQVADDIRVELWRKYAFIAAMAAVCGLARSAIGGVRAAPLGPLLLERAIREVVTVAHARGIRLADDETERILRFCATLPDGMKPSLLLDVEAGRQSEIDAMSGTVGRFGREVGIETPVHDTALAALSTARS